MIDLISHNYEDYKIPTYILIFVLFLGEVFKKKKSFKTHLFLGEKRVVPLFFAILAQIS